MLREPSGHKFFSVYFSVHDETKLCLCIGFLAALYIMALVCILLCSGCVWKYWPLSRILQECWFGSSVTHSSSVVREGEEGEEEGRQAGMHTGEPTLHEHTCVSL